MWLVRYRILGIVYGDHLLRGIDDAKYVIICVLATLEMGWVDHLLRGINDAKHKTICVPATSVCSQTSCETSYGSSRHIYSQCSQKVMRAVDQMPEMQYLDFRECAKSNNKTGHQHFTMTKA